MPYTLKNKGPVPTPASIPRQRLKSGSHEHRKHKDKINTKTKEDISSETCEDKTARIFFCFVFYSVLGLRYDYDLMLMITTIHMSQASLHSFVLPSCLCVCSRVNQALRNKDEQHRSKTMRHYFSIVTMCS